jgi:hypothetical protein
MFNQLEGLIMDISKMTDEQIGAVVARAVKGAPDSFAAIRSVQEHLGKRTKLSVLVTPLGTTQWKVRIVPRGGNCTFDYSCSR